jgi:hypothetical protein
MHKIGARKKNLNEVPVTIRFEKDLYVEIKSHATDEGRSFNRDVLWILKDWFKLAGKSVTEQAAKVSIGKLTGVGVRVEKKLRDKLDSQDQPPPQTGVHPQK